MAKDKRQSLRKPTVLQARSAIVYLPLVSLVGDPLNPRIHSREQVRAIAHSIEAFGFNAPILVDRANRIVAGHGRLEAAKLLGLLEVPVVRLDHLSEHQAHAYMLADNKLTDRSTFDDHRVATVLKELSDIALEFEIEVTGFEAPEIDLRIQSLAPPEHADPEDGFEMPEGSPVSRLGDLWLLDHHRLLCGNALDRQAYEALLGSERAVAVFTDPPYNVKIHGHVSGNGRRKRREFPMASGEMTADEFGQFLEESFRLMAAHSSDDAIYYACMDWRHMTEIAEAIRAIDCEIINVCVWVKTNGGMGWLYRSRHELVFVFGKRGETRRNNVQLGKFGRNRNNVWNYAGANSFARRAQTRDLDHHPTVKPLAMVADAILDVTRRDDIVLDPFCGSGTTIIGAERTSRRGYGIELDPGHVDTAVKRWQKMTKKAAVHASGKSFEEICSERSGADVAA